MRDRVEKLAAGFWVAGEPEKKYPVESTPRVRLRSTALQHNLELTPDEADALGDLLKGEAAHARTKQ